MNTVFAFVPLCKVLCLCLVTVGDDGTIVVAAVNAIAIIAEVVDSCPRFWSFSQSRGGAVRTCKRGARDIASVCKCSVLAVVCEDDIDMV